MRFHLALPELKTLGVITLTPGLMRSAQVVMCFGLPGRTMNETMEFVTMPLVGVRSHELDTRPALTTLVMSGVEREVHEVGGQPVDHRGGLGARGPEGGGDGDTRPGLGLGEGGGQRAVGGLWRRVGHQVDGAARGGAGRKGGEGQPAEGQGTDGGGAAGGAAAAARGAGGRGGVRGVFVHPGNLIHVGR